MICKSKRMGSIASFSELTLIIFALALGVLLFSMAGKFSEDKVIGNFDGEIIEGDGRFVYKVLAELAQNCWIMNNEGTSQDSDVCYNLELNASEELNETAFNDYLDCDILPNNYMNIETRSYDGCGGYDKVYWEILHEETGIKITYSSSRKRIEIIEDDPIYLNEGCLERCNEVCDDAKAKCLAEHSSCMGSDCDSRLAKCNSDADEMHSICTTICRN